MGKHCMWRIAATETTCRLPGVTGRPGAGRVARGDSQIVAKRPSRMDYLVNIANVLYLVSYYMKDMVWLRVLTVVAAGMLLPYFWFRPEPMVAPVLWNLFFIALNLYWLLRMGVLRSMGRWRKRATPSSTARGACATCP